MSVFFSASSFEEIQSELKKKRFNIYSALGISVWQYFDVTLLRIQFNRVNIYVQRADSSYGFSDIGDTW